MKCFPLSLVFVVIPFFNYNIVIRLPADAKHADRGVPRNVACFH